MTLFLRRTVFAFVLGAALAAAVFVGRAAHATTGEISACFKPSNGTLYLLGETSGRQECQPGDIPISWNTAGLNGQDGTSVTSEQLAPGDDAACPNGGSKFTSASGVTYACSGTNGVDGQDGQDGQDGVDGRDGVDGQDGEDFSGTFTSPNGQYKLVVSDTTARLDGPLASVRITGSGVVVEGPQSALNLLGGASSLQSQAGLALNAGTGLAMTGGNGVTITSGSGLTMNAAAAVNMSAANALTLHAQGLFSASGSITTLSGAPIFLNGPGCALLRPTDVVTSVGADGGTILVGTGTPNVRTPC